MRFEDRLSGVIVSVMGLALLGGAAGCAGDKDGATDSGTTPIDLSGVCDGETPPEDYQLALGFVEIEPGGTCPEAADAQLSVNGCTFLEWQDITCGFDRVDTNQVFVDDGYGGYYTDADSVPTGYPTTPVVDVCYYEAVFYLPPDHPTCGRPLLQDGRPVVAPVVAAGSPWADAPHPAVAALTDDERAAVAAHWLESAVLEHASVASFSRFSLDLMRFGAPPELLRDTHRAALDEIEHARVCFALASGYRGAPVAPGPLDAGAVAPASRADVVEALFREGCVGETLAAVDAAARLAGATDPAVREALTLIVRDESAHAALAWRALRWFLAQDEDGTLRARVAAAVDDERARWTAPVAGEDRVSAATAAHGLLSRSARARALGRAWDDVIAPSWAALAPAQNEA